MSGALREHVGKKDAKALRRDAKVPCVMYGKDQQYMFSVDQTAFQRVLFNPEPCFIKVTLNGVDHMAMLKDIEFHPVTEIVYHADFYEMTDDKPVVMSIPVHTTGTSKGVIKGGKLAYKQKRLNVKALPANMPSEVMIDITNLDVNQRVRVQDIATDNYCILNPKSSEVVNVLSTRASATSDDGEEAAAAE